jgi:divalent metal cation (Fe/Co/Zn/Cd) transporter
MQEKTKKHRNLGVVEGWVSVVSNTLLFGLKIWAGSLIGSVAMVADAWHTLSDTLTSLVVIIGFWIAGKPADKDTRLGMDARKILQLSSLEYSLPLSE